MHTFTCMERIWLVFYIHGRLYIKPPGSWLSCIDAGHWPGSNRPWVHDHEQRGYFGMYACRIVALIWQVIRQKNVRIWSSRCRRQALNSLFSIRQQGLSEIQLVVCPSAQFDWLRSQIYGVFAVLTRRQTVVEPESENRSLR